MAADVVGARAILIAATGLRRRRTPRSSTRSRPASATRCCGSGSTRTCASDIPAFVITDRAKVLDAFTAYHRLEEESVADFKAHGEFILELHCYAVPEEMSEAELRATFLEELVQFFPELKGFSIKHESWQCKRDFTAFHTGQYALRPTTETGVPGLVCAGDWVKLPFAAMLLEGACVSGYAAANVLLCGSGPPRGAVGVGAPARPDGRGARPPSRKRLFEATR